MRVDVVEQVVMLKLRRMANFIKDNEREFAEILAQKTNAEMLKEQKYNETELQKALVRNMKRYGFAPLRETVRGQCYG